MKAIILSAGRGERLRPLTNTLPKPMIQINNKPILEYLILLCKNHGIKEIAINTSYLPEKIKEYFGDGGKFGVKIRYSYEPELLGTAGALNNFRDFLNETFVVIYGDNITDIDLNKMINYHKEKRGIATLYLYKEKIADEKTTPGKVIIDENNKIQEIIEKPSKEEKIKLKKISEKRKFTNSGIYVLEPEILNLIPQGFSDFACDIFSNALKKWNLYGFQEKCYIREIGQMQRYLKAKQEIESREVKLNFFKNE